jgi:hypothetical protein
LLSTTAVAAPSFANEGHPSCCTRSSVSGSREAPREGPQASAEPCECRDMSMCQPSTTPSNEGNRKSGPLFDPGSSAAP